MPRNTGRRGGPSLSYLVSFLLGAAVVVGAVVGGLVSGWHDVEHISQDARERHAVACTSDGRPTCVSDERVSLVSDGSDDDDNWWIVVDETVGPFTVASHVPVDQDYAQELRYPEPATLDIIDGRAVRISAAQASFPTEDDPTHQLYGAIRGTFTSGYVFLLGIAWLLAYVALAVTTRVWRLPAPAWWRRRGRADDAADDGPTLSDVARADPVAWRRGRARTDRRVVVAAGLLALLPAVLGVNVGLGLYADREGVVALVLSVVIGVGLTVAVVWFYRRSTRTASRPAG